MVKRLLQRHPKCTITVEIPDLPPMAREIFKYEIERYRQAAAKRGGTIKVESIEERKR